MSKQLLTRNEHATEVAEARPKLKSPPLYKVILINDDYTPMDFVVKLIEYFFFASHEKAVQIMLQIHQSGKGVCGVYSKDIAETKVEQVNNYSKQNGYPLLCVMEAC